MGVAATREDELVRLLMFLLTIWNRIFATLLNSTEICYTNDSFYRNMTVLVNTRDVKRLKFKYRCFKYRQPFLQPTIRDDPNIYIH